MIRTLLLMPWKFIPDIYTAHGPNAYTKSLFKEIWMEEPELLQQTCTHRFRNSTDVVQHMFKAWQLCSGNFYPRKPICESHNLFTEQIRIKKVLLAQKMPILSLNDEEDNGNFEYVKNELLEWFNTILPDKSSFEK